MTSCHPPAVRASTSWMTLGALSVLCFTTFLLPASGCSEAGVTRNGPAVSADPADLPGEATPQDVARTDRYSGIRGVVVGLPDRTGGSVHIDHEAIPSFKWANGDAAGMKQMVMPFPIAEGVSLEGLGSGDGVSFDFVVHWNHDGIPSYAITGIRAVDDATPHRGSSDGS